MSSLAGTELNAYSLSSTTMHAEQANIQLRSIQFKAVTAFSRLREDVGKLGTPQDTLELRNRIGKSTEKFKALAQEFQKKAAEHPDKSSVSTQKLLRDFQGLLQNSERVMELAKAREASSLPGTGTRPTLHLATTESSDARYQADEQKDQERQVLLELQQKQELLQIDNELTFNEAVIDEREQAINNISGQIGEVHQIFQDLAVLVNDQGEQLNDIEANITRAAEQTGDANVQIQKAERLQRKARNTWCFFMLMCGGVLGIFLLILLS